LLLNTYGHTFPYGTLVSNIVAGLLLGFIIGLDRAQHWLPSNVRLLLTTGIMGGLSTFSTFSLETVDFFVDGKYGYGFLNIFFNLILSLLFVVIGMAAAKYCAAIK
jgi:CrcB protein